MALVARNEVLGCANAKLDLFLRKAGSPVDVEVLEYQIFDVSTPAKQITPVQVYPGSGRATLNTVDDCPTGQRLGQGHYAAVWTVPAMEPLGSHEIQWFFKETAFSAEETFKEEFEVSSVAGAGSDNLYITVADVRAAGIDSTIASDTTVETAILINQQFIERVTRQWFNERTLTLQMDGNGADTLFLPVPIIEVTELYTNDNVNVRDPATYRVYNGRFFPDDRKNPRIKLIRSSTDSDIFSDPFRSSRPATFIKGWQNQKIVGSFGYVEADGSTPELIKRALLKLVIEKLTNPVYVPAGSVPPAPPPPGPVGSVIRETTDGHTIQYTFVKFGDTRAGVSGYTMDREVLTILDLYKAPIGVAVASAAWIA